MGFQRLSVKRSNIFVIRLFVYQCWGVSKVLISFRSQFRSYQSDSDHKAFKNVYVTGARVPINCYVGMPITFSISVSFRFTINQTALGFGQTALLQILSNKKQSFILIEAQYSCQIMQYLNVFFVVCCDIEDLGSFVSFSVKITVIFPKMHQYSGFVIIYF